MNDQRKSDDEEESEADRRAANIFLLVAAVIVVGGGVWLVNALVDARRTEECFESGRRNCAPISVPERQRD
jgi:cytoskeletal protein RodZ